TSDGQCMGDRLPQRRCLEVVAKLLQADESSTPVLQALHQNHREGRQQEHDEDDANGNQQALREAFVPVHVLLDATASRQGNRIDGGAGHCSTRRQSAGSAICSVDPSTSRISSALWRETLISRGWSGAPATS